MKMHRPRGQTVEETRMFLCGAVPFDFEPASREETDPWIRDCPVSPGPQKDSKQGTGPRSMRHLPDEAGLDSGIGGFRGGEISNIADRMGMDIV
ncbi:MAG: hypothetical protein OXG56_09145 [Gammaproteobacteria bacterium]|nr:hypothetical protein [Gammaproteobacteria bacterium]